MVSIFISVVSLHPIILAYIDPPPDAPHENPSPPMSIGAATGIMAVVSAAALGVTFAGLVPGVVSGIAWSLVFAWYWLSYCERIYPWITNIVIQASEGWRRHAMIVLTIAMYLLLPIWGFTLKVGDMTPGAALLFPQHPYNVAYDKLNSKFLGASQLIVVIDTMRPNGIKEAGPLNVMEELADHMEGAKGAGGSITVLEIVKVLASLYRDGDPKWGIVPVNPRDIAELFYFFENAAAAGDLDRFMDSSARYGSVTTLFRDYSHNVIMSAIDRARDFGAEYEGEEVRFRYAGGLFGILAAVNEEVEGSYWISLGMIFGIVYWCLYLTYGTFFCSLILMIPVVLSQLAAEALMVWLSIDLNVNSLPVAAAGAGVGVDYGIYHFSRMVDTYDELGDLDAAVDYATATTGKAIIFTASTMMAGTVFWWFSELKFQAEMGFLLAALMLFNTFGGLVVVPAFVKVLRPSFFIKRHPRHYNAELAARLGLPPRQDL